MVDDPRICSIFAIEMAKEIYKLFIDECGDQNLSNFDPSFPIFTLCGVIVSQDQLKALNEKVNELKQHFWGEKKIILHSRDIRKCQKGFEILFDLDVKKDFYQQINDILICEDLYKIVACSIRKEPYIRQYGRFNDVYAQSLSFVLERAIFYLESLHSSDDTLLDVVVEMRGKKEDANLLNYFNQLLDRGTYWVSSDRMRQHINSFKFKPKKDNINGLQIADLVAYPITRHILDSEMVNLAYDVLERNIFKEGEKILGLKVIPQE